MCGDFNIHVDQSGDPHAIRLAELLLSFDCIQHVNEPTHTAGHILDLVITTATTGIQDLRVGDMLSDHALVCFNLQLNKPASAAEYVTRRAWRRFSHDAFASDLAASKLCCDLETCENMSVDDLVQLYNRVLTELLDKHCPCVTVRRRNRQATLWFDADCHSARYHARATEMHRCTQADEDRRT